MQYRESSLVQESVEASSYVASCCRLHIQDFLPSQLIAGAAADPCLLFERDITCACGIRKHLKAKLVEICYFYKLARDGSNSSSSKFEAMQAHFRLLARNTRPRQYSW